MKTFVFVIGYFTLSYRVIFIGWLLRHRLQRKLDNVVEVPDADLLEPQDLVDACPVTGGLHRWKCQGEDRRGTFYSQCEDCGTVTES